MGKKRRRGFVIAMILTLLALLAMLGSAMASFGTAGLVQARQSVQAERALALADAGLATATQKLIAAPSTISWPYSESFPGEGSFKVEKMVNPNNALLNTAWGVTMPPKSTLLRSVGTTPQGNSRVSVALFRSSIGAFQVGGLANLIQGAGSTFDSYDSSLEASTWTGPGPDPASLITTSTILASNKASGVVVNLADSTVDGNVFLGPGGDVVSQIAMTNSTVGLTGLLSSPIQNPAVVVPTLPNGATPNSASAAANPSPVTLKSPSGTADTTITPPSKNGAPIVITHYCLTVKIQPDGKFTATEGGSGAAIEGNVNSGTMKTLSSPSGGKAPLTVLSYNPLDIKGNWHHIVYNPANSSIAIDQNGIKSPPPATVNHPALPGWIFFNTAPPGQTGPATLLPGKYDNVNIQNAVTSLVDGGVYVIKNLTVDNAGKLFLSSANQPVQIFVTGSLKIDGADAIVNSSRKPTGLRIFYTGNSPVMMSGGSEAYCTLFAPAAPVTLTGYGGEFFGAISADTLTINQAKFHYDVATQGVGTGIDATNFQLLGRYHL